jgi:hypothetical protein
MRKYIDGKRDADDELVHAKRTIAALEDELAKARASITENARRAAIFKRLDAERVRQDAKWGEQNHPMLRLAARRAFVAYDVAASTALLPTAAQARHMCEYEHKKGDGTYTSIALKEFAEFFEACYLHGELSDEALDELVQTGAVFVSMLETLERKRALR